MHLIMSHTDNLYRKRQSEQFIFENEFILKDDYHTNKNIQCVLVKHNMTSTVVSREP